MKVKITYLSKLGFRAYAYFPIVDVETIDDLKSKKVHQLRPSVIGVFFKNKIKQFILRNLNSYEKFKYVVTKELNKLPQPFLAFNSNFDKGVLEGFTGISYKFGEIQEYKFQKKQKAKEGYGIQVYDPFKGDGYLAIVHYRKFLENGKQKHLDLVIKHNLACLVTEYFLWERLLKNKKQ